MKVEEVVRDKFNLFKDMMYTNISDDDEDYLHLLNLSTDDERTEIFEALKII